MCCHCNMFKDAQTHWRLFSFMKAPFRPTTVNLKWTYRLAASQSCPAAFTCMASLDCQLLTTDAISSQIWSITCSSSSFNTWCGHSQETTLKTTVAKYKWKHTINNSSMHSLLLSMYMDTFGIPNKGEAATWEKKLHVPKNTEAQASTPSASSQEAEHNNEHTYNCIRQTQVSGTQRFACWGCSCWCMGRLRARGEREWNWLEIEANWMANEWHQEKTHHC